MVWKILKTIIVLALVVVVFCGALDILFGTQIYRYVSKGYRYADDEQHPIARKVIYNGTLDDIIAEDPDHIDRFVWANAWLREDTDEDDDLCRLECDDYIISHYQCEIYEMGKDLEAHAYTYIIPLPDDLILGERTESKLDVEFLVTDLQSGKNYGFSQANLLVWLQTEHGYPY